MHLWIEAQAARTPNAVATEDSTSALTYHDLNERAEELAGRLRSAGARANLPVGIYLHSSADFVVAILAVLKSGGAFVPLDPAYPPERLRYILDNAHIPLIVTDGELAGDLPRDRARIVSIQANGHVQIHEPDPKTDRIVTVHREGDSAAYIIYTSGSTGTPRGVAVTHRNIIASTRARLLYYRSPADRFLLLSSFAFDSAAAGVFWTLCSGGTLVIPEKRIEQDVQALADLVSEKGITHTLCLPSLYGTILHHAPPEALTSIHAVIVAGEACPRSVATRHFVHLPHVDLFNEYGPTEATVWSTVYQVPADFSGEQVPIGRPIPGVRTYVFDGRRQLVPLCVPGELYIGGAGVAEGYVGEPEMTRSRFISDPLGAAGDRIYRTGDLVRWMPDGNLEFIGRTDRQLKIRGYRIEPGEIEAALAQHPSVQECVVVARRPAGGQHPTAPLARDQSDADARHASGWPDTFAERADIRPNIAALVAELEAMEASEANRLLSQVSLSSVR